MLSLTTPIKIALAAACLVVVAVIIAVDVARTRGREETPAPAPAAAAAVMVEALPPAFQPPKPAGEAVICPSPAAPAAAPGAPVVKPEAPKPPAAEPVKEKAPEEPPKTYTVTQGDTLYGISQKVFGTPRHYERIYEMNKDRIRDPNTLQVGINLRMPETGAKPVR